MKMKADDSLYDELMRLSSKGEIKTGSLLAILAMTGLEEKLLADLESAT